MTSAPKYRAMRYGITRIQHAQGADGVHYVQAEQALQAHPQRMTDRLMHWAHETPERTFLARRKRLPDGRTGDWEHLSYGRALAGARRIGQALLARNLSAERPVVILSENSLEHAMVALGCLLVGIPHCPVSPAYSTVSKDFDKLRHILSTLTPGLVFATDAEKYAAAITAAVPANTEVVLAHGHLPHRNHTPLSALFDTPDTAEVDAAMDAIGPETIVKFLFTSGSTNMPKGVINTHGMGCATNNKCGSPCPCWAKHRQCWWIGCRGTTRLVATTTSASRCFMAVLCSSMTANQCPP